MLAVYSGEVRGEVGTRSRMRDLMNVVWLKALDLANRRITICEVASMLGIVCVCVSSVCSEKHAEHESCCFQVWALYLLPLLCLCINCWLGTTQMSLHTLPAHRSPGVAVCDSFLIQN